MPKKAIKFLIVSAVLFFAVFGAENIFAQDLATGASSKCWSSSDCMKQTGNCQACFEKQDALCGEGRGYCYAKPIPTDLEITLPGLGTVNDPAQYLSALYQWGVSVTGILAGIMIMIGGLLYLTAGGSPERVTNAKGYISNALIGMVLAMTSYFLLQTVNPALLSLRFPKVPMAAPAIAFTTFCEELEQAGISVTPESPGKTGCGDLGIPEGGVENEQVPTKCSYAKCANPDLACLPCSSSNLLECPKPANCTPCAGVRLDPALAAISDPSNFDNGHDFQTPRRIYGSLTCGKLDPIAQYPHINKCEFLDNPSMLGTGSVWESFKAACGDFGTGAIWASLGSGALRSGVAKFASVGEEAAGFTTKVSTAEVYASKIATSTDVAGTAVSTVGGVTGSSTLTSIGDTVSFAATCGGGTLIALSNPVALIAGGTYAAVKEWLKVGDISLHPENYFGVKGTCALVKIDCNEISSCEDYAKKIKFKAATEKSWQEILVEMALEPDAFLSNAQNIRSYCDLNPCQLPLHCVSAIQNSWYWSPTSGRTGEVKSPSEAIAFGTDLGDYKCIPAEMAAISSDPGTGRWLLNQEGITNSMIYPIVYPFAAGGQQKGELCLTSTDCASGLCSDAGITYKDVYKLNRNSYQTIKNGTASDRTLVEYKRCQ